MKKILFAILILTISLFVNCKKDTSAQQQEQIDLTNYLTTNKITVAPTADGLYFIRQKTGVGKKCVNGDTISVNYVGRLINGTIFDQTTTTPFTFQLGVDQLIQGFQEGISMMYGGDTALLIIPSSIGYGGTAVSSSIPAYSTLIFTVQIVSTK